MDIQNFYPTSRTNTNGNEYSATLPNLTDYTSKGFVPYYLGWIDKDNIPETYHLTKISFDGTKLISKPLEITANADLFYTARNLNPLTTGGFSFASRYNSASGSYTGYYGSYSTNIEAVNKMSLLTQNIAPPAFTFSFIYRPVSGGVLGNTLIANYNYNFPSIISFINWLNGTYKINFNSAFSGVTLTDVELSANDFLTDRAFPYVDSSYNGYIIITACTIAPRADTINDSPTNAGYSDIMGSVSVTYKDEDDIFDIYLHSQYHPTGHVQIFYSGAPRLYSNPITFYGYYFGGFDIETDLAEMSDTTEIYQGENWLAYRPYNLSNYRYFYKKMSINEIRFLFAMQPILRYASELANVYYPKFENGELTGEFFPASRLAFDGAPWQITGNLTDNKYDPATKPEIDDDENIWESTDYTGDRIFPDFNRNLHLLARSFTTFYDLSQIDVNALVTNLSNTASTFWEALGTSIDTKQENLLPYIVSLRYYPFQIFEDSDTAITTLQFGFDSDGTINLVSSSSLSSYRLANNTKVYNLGSVTIPTKYSNKCFLDFDPYTTTFIYLPFLGYVELKSIDVIEETLTLYCSLDLVTGLGTYYLYNGNKVILTESCSIGSDITVSANDIVTQSEKMTHAYFNQANTVVSTISDVGEMHDNMKYNVIPDSSGVTVSREFRKQDVENVAHDSLKLVENAVNISMASRNVPVKVTSGSGFGNINTVLTPMVFVHRPSLVIPAKYGHNFGYVVYETHRLEEMSGYTVCSNPDLSGIYATEEEKNIIRNYLTTGIFL